MESGERTSAFWMAEAARASAMAEPMKNPLAKRGMEQIARCYEDFARRAEKLNSAKPQVLGHHGEVRPYRNQVRPPLVTRAPPLRVPCSMAKCCDYAVRAVRADRV